MKKSLLILLLAIIILPFIILSQLQGITFGGAPGNPSSSGSPSIFKQYRNWRDKMDKMEQLKANLEFTCKHEERPPLSEETQQLYNYALYQDLHKMWTGKKGDWNELAHYYRIAAYNGDYKANVRLQYLLKTGRISSETPQTEVLYLNEELAKQLPATAYYNLYGYLKTGYGVTTEKDGQYAYLRKAADLGSREAQYVVADMLLKIDDEDSLELRSKIMQQLLSCASEQGLGKSSYELGIDFEINKEYSKALITFHQGVKNGSTMAAYNLQKIFAEKTKENYLETLHLEADEERSRRYGLISKYLSYNEHLSPKVPDLDEIVPLPPAPLPKWDGKIAFQRWFEDKAPPKPDLSLMDRLAWRAGLDVETGLDLQTGLPKRPKK